MQSIGIDADPGVLDGHLDQSAFHFKGANVYSGFTLGNIINATRDYDVVDIDTGQDYNQSEAFKEISNTDFGIPLGLQYRFKSGLAFDLQYTCGILSRDEIDEQHSGRLLIFLGRGKRDDETGSLRKIPLYPIGNRYRSFVPVDKGFHEGKSQACMGSVPSCLEPLEHISFEIIWYSGAVIAEVDLHPPVLFLYLHIQLDLISVLELDTVMKQIEEQL